MPWWARLLIHYGAPLVAQAAAVLIDRLAQAGEEPDAALGVAVDIVAGLERSAVPVSERHATAHAAIALYLERNGREASAATVNALLEMALLRVRGR